MSGARQVLEDTTLVGRDVELDPLRAGHERALLEAAADGELWNLTVTVVPGPDTIAAYLATALRWREEGTALPFVIRRRDTGRVVGCTRLWGIDLANRKLEIGHTWLGASAQRTRVNTESKLLLLAHAFETMGCIRVQFTTDELNEASRAAILRLGAVQEGIIRHERIMPGGRKRNSVLYGILDHEWPAVKTLLEGKLARGRETPGEAPRRALR